MRGAAGTVVTLCAALCSCQAPSLPECSRPSYQAALEGEKEARAAMKSGDFRKAHDILDLAIDNLGKDYARLSYGHPRTSEEPVIDDSELYLLNVHFQIDKGDFKAAAEIEKRVLDSRLALFKSGYQCN
jgi:hypothetical protein